MHYLSSCSTNDVIANYSGFQCIYWFHFISLRFFGGSFFLFDTFYMEFIMNHEQIIHIYWFWIYIYSQIEKRFRLFWFYNIVIVIRGLLIPVNVMYTNLQLVSSIILFYNKKQTTLLILSMWMTDNVLSYFIHMQLT